MEIVLQYYLQYFFPSVYCNSIAILYVNLVHTSQPKNVNDVIISSVFTCSKSLLQLTNPISWHEMNFCG